ncbi:MAG: 30S ribosomal protein S16 [Verrucomicrobiaceae bacterium]|nr:MAG: 30S ribosomal protein S16 [Verrucomicrobiaceae bacterium]
MVAIRLRREGSKDRPYYRIVVTDSRARRDGPFIEQVGTYDPMQNSGTNYRVDLSKVDSWLSKGAQPSETVASLIRKTRKALPAQVAAA